MDYVADFVKASATISIPLPSLPSHTSHHHAPHHTHSGHHGHEGHDVTYSSATKTGEKTLMIVFWLFAAGFTVATLGALRVEKKARLFHILTASVLACAMISYLAMATGHGVHDVATHFKGKHSDLTVIRQVYYARYIDWLFTTPLLLVSLAFLAGLSTLDSAILVLYDIGMIVTGLIGGVTKASDAPGITAKWTWFTISCVFFIAILYMLATGGVKAANLRPSKTRGLFYLLGGLTGVLWTAYPIVWALTEGAAVISVDKEIILYAILDVSAKLGFGFLLLGVHGGGNGEDDYVMPEWAVTPRSGSEGGRGGYGAIRVGDD